jgi:uncharacterized membrane protein YeaQ/YmgE (transglycosylase-associated protein family)
MIAEIVLQPVGVMAWLVVGLLGGLLGGQVAKGPGYGVLIDLIVGVIGAGAGGFVFWIFMTGDVGFWGSIATAFAGAFLAAFATRYFGPEPLDAVRKPSSRIKRSRR